MKLSKIILNLLNLSCLNNLVFLKEKKQNFGGASLAPPNLIKWKTAPPLRSNSLMEFGSGKFDRMNSFLLIARIANSRQRVFIMFNLIFKK
jgi:hypothetical protein